MLIKLKQTYSPVALTECYTPYKTAYTTCPIDIPDDAGKASVTPIPLEFGVKVTFTVHSCAVLTGIVTLEETYTGTIK